MNTRYTNKQEEREKPPKAELSGLAGGGFSHSWVTDKGTRATRLLGKSKLIMGCFKGNGQRQGKGGLQGGTSMCACAHLRDGHSALLLGAATKGDGRKLSESDVRYRKSCGRLENPVLN